MKARVLYVLALVVAVAVVVSRSPALGIGLRTAFVLASAAPIGGVLLLAIARLTGADWPAATTASRSLAWFVPLAALAMVSATDVSPPPHLATWSNPLFVAARAAVFVGALAYAGHRLRAGAGPTLAGVTLALYAAVVTPIGADWLMPAAPGHPVSAIGMMLFLVQFAAGCALALPLAQARQRRDLSLLLVAALLGLCYLGFVDYLIVWFGNLPTRVPFYLARSGWPAVAALTIGFAGTLAAVIAGRTDAATVTAATGLTLFAMWWIGGGLLAVLLTLALLALGAVAWRGEAARG